MTIVNGTTGGTVVGYPYCGIIAAKAAQNDILTIFDKKGFVPREVMVHANAAAGSSATTEPWEYTVIRVNGIAGVGDTSMPYDTAVANERTSGDYYVFSPVNGEMLYVKNDSGYTTTSGTLTVVRGCLGTTESSIADDSYLIVMNAIKLKGSATGKIVMFYDALPEDHKANLF